GISEICKEFESSENESEEKVGVEKFDSHKSCNSTEVNTLPMEVDTMIEDNSILEIETEKPILFNNKKV
ncbi:hypothetical protein PMALA_030480, partial [Plasmodium malariae]